jgi:NAD(P)-dependent dehydrogenase (short-subunit alcohol dehydrogenase family)
MHETLRAGERKRNSVVAEKTVGSSTSSDDDATTRSVDSLTDLTERYSDRVLALPLDVIDRAAAFATVQQSFEHFGSLDTVVNNADYGQFGMIEEVLEDDLRAQIGTICSAPFGRPGCLGPGPTQDRRCRGATPSGLLRR